MGRGGGFGVSRLCVFGWGGCLSLRSLNIELGNSGDPVVSETDAAAGVGEGRKGAARRPGCRHTQAKARERVGCCVG